MHALKNTMRALLFSINFPNFAIRNFGSLTTFAKKPLPSSNVVLVGRRRFYKAFSVNLEDFSSNKDIRLTTRLLHDHIKP